MIRFQIRTVFLTILALSMASCASVTSPCVPDNDHDIVYVVTQAWHAEIGIPADELDGKLVYFRTVFPDAKVMLFGYGKRTFFTAPAHTLSEYILGPFPGPAAIHAVGINVTPPEIYDSGDVITLNLPQGGRQALLDYLWADLAKDELGNPEMISRSTNPEGLFYAAVGEYNLLHTCNTWTADALKAAKIPLSDDTIVFSAQVTNQLADIARQQCELVR